MTNFTKLSALLAGAALLALTACSTVSPENEHNAKMQAKHQMMANDHTSAEHKSMMQKMKMDHDMMAKMDMSKIDMARLSPECQTMMKKGEMGMMKDHNFEKMKAMMAKHKKCMAEMKASLQPAKNSHEAGDKL